MNTCISHMIYSQDYRLLLVSIRNDHCSLYVSFVDACIYHNRVKPDTPQLVRVKLVLPSIRTEAHSNDRLCMTW